jgi:hypothetical protein
MVGPSGDILIVLHSILYNFFLFMAGEWGNMVIKIYHFMLAW